MLSEVCQGCEVTQWFVPALQAAYICSHPEFFIMNMDSRLDAWASRAYEQGILRVQQPITNRPSRTHLTPDKVCMFACVSVSMQIYLSFSLSLFLSFPLSVSSHIYIYIYRYVCIHKSKQMYTCIHTYTYCIYTYCTTHE